MVQKFPDSTSQATPTTTPLPRRQSTYLPVYSTSSASSLGSGYYHQQRPKRPPRPPRPSIERVGVASSSSHGHAYQGHHRPDRPDRPDRPCAPPPFG